MSAALATAGRDLSLEEVRLALHGMLAAHRRLRNRDGRLSGSIGFAQYRLLSALRREGELTASVLAVAADLAPPTVSEMTDGLVGAGLVERRREPTDRRLVVLRLTALGRREYDAKHATLVAAWDRELSDLDADALAGATAVLERLATFFDTL
jgi:DNA-binding MarR family transcriptional regulator